MVRPHPVHPQDLGEVDEDKAGGDRAECGVANGLVVCGCIGLPLGG